MQRLVSESRGSECNSCTIVCYGGAVQNEHPRARKLENNSLSERSKNAKHVLLLRRANPRVKYVACHASLGIHDLTKPSET